MYGAIGLSPRSYFDTVTDETLTGRQESGDSLFFLQTRLYNPLPDGDLGAVKGGAYFAGTSGLSEYYYSVLGQLYRTGSYRPDVQSNSKPSGIITRLVEYPESLTIFTRNQTYYVDTTIIDEGGETAVGESTPVYSDPRLVTNRIGCPAENCSTRHDAGGEFIFTNEPAIRYFDGYKYSDDLSLNLVRDSEVLQFDLNVVMEYDKLRGLNLWGIKNEEA